MLLVDFDKAYIQDICIHIYMYIHMYVQLEKGTTFTHT